MQWDSTQLLSDWALTTRMGRLGLSGVGEGLGMHWDSIKLL